MHEIISAFFDILYFLILIRILLSFLPINPYGSQIVINIVRFVYQVTEPILAPFRNIIPTMRMGGASGIDFSPLLALIFLSIIRRLLFYIL